MREGQKGIQTQNPEVAGTWKEAQPPEMAGTWKEAQAPEVAETWKEAQPPEVTGTWKEAQNPDLTGNPQEKRSYTDSADVDALTALLDGCVRAGESRIIIEVTEGTGGMISREYHHGRCDIGSPWARGAAFDVLE